MNYENKISEIKIFINKKQILISRISIATILLGLIISILLTTVGTNLQRDFIQDYYAARLWGQSFSIYSQELSRLIQNDFNIFLENYHPPSLAILYYPLSKLSYPSALIINNLSLILVYFWMLYSTLKYLNTPIYINNLIIAVAFVWTPYLTSIYQANISAQIACIAVLIYLISEGSNSSKSKSINFQIISGLLLGLISLLKLYPLYLFGYFILKRKYLLVLSGIFSFVVFGLFTYLLIGKSDILIYVNDVAPKCAAQFSNHFANVSLRGIVYPWMTEGGLIKPLISKNFLAEIIVYLVILFTFIATLITTLRAKIKSKENDLLSYSLWLNGMILISPISWQYSLLSLIPQIIILAKDYIKNSNSKLLLFLFIISILSFLADYDRAHLLALKSQDYSIDLISFIVLTKFQSIFLLSITLLLFLTLNYKTVEDKGLEE